MTANLYEQLTGEEDIDLKRAAVDSIKPLYDLKEEKKAYEKGIKLFDPEASNYGAYGPLRRWLTDNPGERLHNDAGDLVAYLASGGSHVTVEAAAIVAEADPSLFRRLLALGLVEIQGAKVKDAVREGKIAQADVERWLLEGDRTPRLMVVKK